MADQKKTWIDAVISLQEAGDFMVDEFCPNHGESCPEICKYEKVCPLMSISEAIARFNKMALIYEKEGLLK